MRILTLSPRQCWPPLSGAKLRDYYFARALGRRADVTYAQFTEPGAKLLSGSDLPFCRKVIPVPKPKAYTLGKIARGLTGRWPLSVVNYVSEAMVGALEQATRGERFDLVYLEGIHMAGYVDPLARMFGAWPRVVNDWHNIESELMRRYRARTPLHGAYARLTARQLEWVERRQLEKGFGNVVCSERERAQLAAIAPQARIAVVENGVDTEYFAGTAAARAPGTSVVYVGSMDYHPNIDAVTFFAREIWPTVRKRLPSCRFVIVGAKPAPAVVALGQLEGVEVTGTVPDVRPYYRDALAAIVPLRTGGGTRLKILEAMAAGVPVVSTALGAEGLVVEPDRHLAIVEADDADAWGRALERLAGDGAWARELTGAALARVRERYDWAILGESLGRTFEGWLG